MAAISPDRWPLPESVGAWGTRRQFDAQRPESGQWVFWPDRVEAVLAGMYTNVLPLHVEVSPTYLCNFSCPWCSTRSAREEWSGEDVFSHPRASNLTVMRAGRLDAVVDHLADHGVEVMWVGGEPTMNPLLYPAVRRLAERHVNQCLFTNGSLLNIEHTHTLFEAGLVFVRVSLNSVSPDVHRRQHGYSEGRPYVERVLTNLDNLASLRAQQLSHTRLGVSVVVDATNIEDVPATLNFLVDLCERHGYGAIDYVLVRPVFPMVGSHINIDDDARSGFLKLIEPHSSLVRRFVEAGIDLVTPSASIEAQQHSVSLDDGRGCLAAGWFGEVTPTGDLLPCSDLYGDIRYVIGNVAGSTLGEIWSAPRRGQVLELIREQRCPAQRCPSNGRGYFFNHLFRDVERFRAAGRMNEVDEWILGLRACLPEPEHSFFL